MKVAELLKALKALDIRLSVEGGDLRVRAPAGKLTQELQQEIRTLKAGLLEVLSGTEGRTEREIVRVPRDSTLPLSSFQRRLWVLNRLDPQSSAYHLAAWQTWDMPLDLEALEESVSDLVDRHEILRTNFRMGELGPELAVRSNPHVAPPVLDWRKEATEDLDARLRTLAMEEAKRPIDLAEGSLFRSLVVRLDEDSFSVVVILHHIITDAWSLGLVLAEWKARYGAAQGGQTTALPEPSIQYADFAAWQQKFLETDEVQRQEGFWLEYLEDVPTVLTLPSDRPRTAMQSFDGGVHIFGAGANSAQGLKDLCGSEGVTPFMVWLSVFGLMLSRYSGQKDFLIGSPAAARTQPVLESMLGPFVNTLVFRFRVEKGDTVRSLLARTRESMLAVHAHQAVPFERLVEILPTQRTMAHPPLFQVSCAYHNQPGRSEFSVSTGGSMFELTLNGFEVENELAGSFEFSQALFDDSTIHRMAQHFRTLLRGMVANPAEEVAKIPMVPAEEVKVLTEDWNQGPDPQEGVQWVLGAFEERVREHPTSTALVFRDTQLSYLDLWERVSSIHSALVENGLAPGGTAAVLLPRGVEMVAAPLAIMKAGGTYVPLDPEYPKNRIEYILEDSGARIILTDRSVSEGLGGLEAKEIHVENLPGSGPDEHGDGVTSPSPLPPSPDDLAYLIYTSGTTGRPKGVEVTHGGLANVLASLAEEPGFKASDTMLAITTFAFDIAGVELFLPLIRGGTVILAPADVADHGKRLRTLMTESNPTVMQATPATWQMLLDAGWVADNGPGSMRIWSGGEALPRPLAEELLKRGKEVWNLYGPTETSIWSTLWRVESDSGSVPIGRPLSATTLLVLDPSWNPAPIGIPGELFIGGAGVARGYRNRLDETLERFLPIHEASDSGSRLYRTGDLVRWTAGGFLEYLGRIDQQVKVRGHRIELGEIESVLLQHPSVQATAGAVWEGRIVAYVVFEPGQEENAAEIRRFLRDQLPEYMIPGFVVSLPELPMTENRKIDRKNLPSPQGGTAALRTRSFEAPEGPQEVAIAAIWQDLLGKEINVGANDNFFELGGHSLLALQAVYRIEQLTGRPLDTRAIFFETLRQIAAR